MAKLWIVLVCVFIFVANANAELRDPTKPPGANETTPSQIGKGGLVVSSIVYGKRRKHATINGEVLGVGDKVGNIEVVGITPDSVRFKDEEGEFDIPLLKSGVKISKIKKE